MSRCPHLPTLPNRVLMGSVHLSLEEAERGFERMAAFYAERARGGAGLIVTGGIAPDERGRPFPDGAKMTTEAEAEQHALVTETVHREGGRIAMQILHTGRYAHHPDLFAPAPARRRSTITCRRRSPMMRSRRQSRRSSWRLRSPGQSAMTASRSWGPRAT